MSGRMLRTKSGLEPVEVARHETPAISFKAVFAEPELEFLGAIMGKLGFYAPHARYGQQGFENMIEQVQSSFACRIIDNKEVAHQPFFAFADEEAIALNVAVVHQRVTRKPLFCQTLADDAHRGLVVPAQFFAPGSRLYLKERRKSIGLEAPDVDDLRCQDQLLVSLER